MSLFKSGAEKELDSVIRRLEMNLSNNYKDSAQDNLREFEQTLLSMREAKRIKGGALAKYEATLADYQQRMKGYTHKDQKPYWH